MIEELSVSQLSAMIKMSLESNFPRIKLTAEVSALKIHSSGHAYFSLKDENAAIDAICWKWTLQKHKHQLENGQKIACYGKVSSYSAQSKYQFIVDKFEPAGIGNLLKILEDRKKKLAEEGLFSAEHKKPIPKIPKIIGVITSPTGAVIRDIMHRVRQRFPTPILIWPVLVQGTEAAKQIEAALDGMNNLPEEHRPSVLIVARGGGSFEDLMPFNEENVVRAVFRSKIPVISAVGHETDTTLIDYVSDLRAPTPTAGAEFAVPEKIKLRYDLDKAFLHMSWALSNTFEKKRLYLNSGKLLDIKGMLAEKIQRTDLAFERAEKSIMQKIQAKKVALSRLNLEKPVFKYNPEKIWAEIRFSFLNKLETEKHKLDLAAGTLESCSYINILRKGYAFAESIEHIPITTVCEARKHSELSLTFSDGSLRVYLNPPQQSLFEE